MKVHDVGSHPAVRRSLPVCRKDLIHQALKQSLMISLSLLHIVEPRNIRALVTHFKSNTLIVYLSL